MNILLIEDELLIQKSLQKILQKRGANVDVTAFGNDAILKINEFDYDRIICDLMLSDISGFDIIEDSKMKYSSDEITNKFIIITAYSTSEIIEKAKSYGCKILSKPFENLEGAISLFLNLE